MSQPAAFLANADPDLGEERVHREHHDSAAEASAKAVLEQQKRVLIADWHAEQLGSGGGA